MARIIATSEPPSNNAESPLSDFGTYPALHHLSMAAAQRYTADINGLISTKIPHFRIIVRVLSIWKVYMKADQKEIKSLELIFIDAQGGKIQATIPKSFMDSFINYFEEGCVRQIACFHHALNIVDVIGHVIGEPRVYYPNKLNELKGKKCLFKLDVSHKIKNKQIEIDAETSTEFGLNMTQTDDSTAKTAVSCTEDVNIQNADVGTPLEDTADSPPPKKTKSTQDPESVKSHQNKCVRKI
ncbi:OLC1v1018834C1 [Oldenlandia corymbosa var. corymbosa]|uniref:OLC1v1018834C1 n=1 Tax=Oldenlandia corymbosa var. corymbosa TaxID=529605 RepID=A0AAV1ECM5_OLDCO|nr:OLC1v1018834C1 [Oldenlandia corymbosa var. corymbosa]